MLRISSIYISFILLFFGSISCAKKEIPSKEEFQIYIQKQQEYIKKNNELILKFKACSSEQSWNQIKEELKDYTWKFYGFNGIRYLYISNKEVVKNGKVLDKQVDIISSSLIKLTEMYESDIKK